MPIASYRGLGSPSARVSFLSTLTTAVTLTDADQDALLVWNGQTSAARISLPAPEAGKTFRFFFNAEAVSTATKIIANALGTYDIALMNTTGVAVAAGSTNELGLAFELVGLNDTRWGLFQLHGSTVLANGMNSTTT